MKRAGSASSITKKGFQQVFQGDEAAADKEKRVGETGQCECECQWHWQW